MDGLDIVGLVRKKLDYVAVFAWIMFYRWYDMYFVVCGVTYYLHRRNVDRIVWTCVCAHAQCYLCLSVGLSAKDALLLHVSGGLSSMGGARMCCIRPSFGIGIFNFVLHFITRVIIL